MKILSSLISNEFYAREKMRFLVFFWLLIACFGMLVLYEVGDECLTQSSSCFDENSTGYYAQICFEGVQNATRSLEKDLDRSLMPVWDGWLYCCALSIFCCLGWILVLIFSSKHFRRHLNNREKYFNSESDNIHEGNYESSLQSVARNRFHTSYENVELECDVCDFSPIRDPEIHDIHQMYVSSQWYQVMKQHTQSLPQISVVLDSEKRLSKSLSNIDCILEACSSFSSNASVYSSSGSLSAKPSLASRRNSCSSLASVQASRSGASTNKSSHSASVLSLVSSNHDGTGMPSSRRESCSPLSLSQASEYTLYTMYSYPIPPSVSSSWFEYEQFKRAGKEYIFIRRPYTGYLFVVMQWLRANFFKENLPAGHVINENERDTSGQIIRYGSSQDFGSNEVIHGVEDQEYRWAKRASYMVNNTNTDVVLCDIPGPTDEFIRFESSGSMFELHRQEKWNNGGFSHAYFSLPNIFHEFGLKNRVEFALKTVSSFAASIEVEDSDSEDTLESIIAREAEERVRAARIIAQFEKDKQNERRMFLRREKERIMAKRSSFLNILKRRSYNDVVLPLLHQVTKEIFTAVWNEF